MCDVISNCIDRVAIEMHNFESQDANSSVSHNNGNKLIVLVKECKSVKCGSCLFPVLSNSSNVSTTLHSQMEHVHVMCDVCASRVRGDM